MRYIELNPVRARMAAHPSDYCWTSYHTNGQGRQDNLVTSHELYNRLGASASQQQHVYRRLFRARLSRADIDAIREATNKNWALGSADFKQKVEALSGRRPDRLRKGRSAKVLPAESRV